LKKTRGTDGESLSEDNDIENNRNIVHSNIETIPDKNGKSGNNISIEDIQTIPVIEEDFDLTKKTVIHETTIVKRMATRTEKIEIPVAYEEVYINNKKLKVYEKEEEGLLSRIKDTITHSVSSPDDDYIEYHYPPSASIEQSKGDSKQSPNPKYRDLDFSTKGEAVLLIEGQEKNETEKIVPIWGEEIIVSKRKVKLGEIVIRKRRVIESKKIDIDIKREKVSVEYPDGFKEELSATPQEVS
jgi:stress response protein YsnF